MVGVVGAHGQLWQSAILRNPGTKYKRAKNFFPVRTFALSCVHICAQLLQPLAQSLIGSPGTLITEAIELWGFRLHESWAIYKKIIQVSMEGTAGDKLWTCSTQVFEEIVVNRFWTVIWLWNPRRAAGGLRCNQFFFEIQTISYRVGERVRVTFRRFFCLISDPQKRGVCVTFL